MRRHTVFAYGTLQFPEIMAAVAGERIAGVPATLEGYARYRVQGAPYPAIAPAPRGRVQGIVYADIGPIALDRIDDFEGVLYRRQPVVVRAADGPGVAAETYVTRSPWQPLLVDEPWDPDAFALQWHDFYVRACRAEYGTGGG